MKKQEDLKIFANSCEKLYTDLVTFCTAFLSQSYILKEILDWHHIPVSSKQVSKSSVKKTLNTPVSTLLCLEQCPDYDNASVNRSLMPTMESM